MLLRLAPVIHHQTQPTPVSCTITCIAMALGVPVETLEVDLNTAYDFHHAGLWLAERGIWLRECVWNGRYGEHFVDGRVYLVGIRSLNNIEGDHTVLLDTRQPHEENKSGWRFYDPNKGRDGRRFTDWVDQNWALDFCELVQHDSRFARMGSPPTDGGNHESCSSQ